MENLTFLHLLILALASHRLTHLLVFDSIFEPVRRFFVVREPGVGPDGKRVTYVTVQGTGLRAWLGRMLSCPWCTGIWVSAAITAGYWYRPTPALWVSLFLAIASAQSLIETMWIRMAGVRTLPGPRP